MHKKHSVNRTLTRYEQKTHLTHYRNVMGESCDEGGPYPPHKIPQETRTRKKCLEQYFIHPSICHVTERKDSSPVPSTKPLLQSFPPPLMQMSPLYEEETSITKDLHYKLYFNPLYKNTEISFPSTKSCYSNTVFRLQTLHPM